MDYEKKYKEALEKARQLCAYPTSKPFISDLQELFPELAESEGERIRKELLAFCKNRAEKYSNDPKYKNISAWIAWLEKQGEKDKEITILKDQIESLHAAIKAVKETYRIKLEKQGEQILANSANTCKDEQKSADNKGMNIDEESMTPFQKKVFCIIDTSIEEEQGLKQVCDELLALASNEIEQKSSWSEEDEEIHRKCICAMRASACGFPEEEKFVEQVDNWLKCLKERYTWKPSDKQINTLEYYMHTLVCNEHKEILFGLYTDLKKLKG